MANGTDKKTYEAAVAAFIKENKPKRQVVYDDLSNQLATPFTLNADEMDKLIQRLKTQVSVWWMKMVIHQFTA